MIKHYETFEVKIDSLIFVERMRGTDVFRSKPNDDFVNGYPVKSGWGFCEVDSSHGKDDYLEVRIYPDGTCIKQWKNESDESRGSENGKLLRPYEELVQKLEDGDTITQFIEWEELPF